MFRPSSVRVPGVLSAVLLVAWGTGAASERRLAAPVKDMIEVEVAGLRADPFGAPVLLLREPGSSDVLPVFIGPVEANAILRGLHGARTPRPLTHELLGGALAGAGARLERVYIDDFAGGTYFGMLELKVRGRRKPVHVDSRPSDAIALALQAGASIHVSPKVLALAERIDVPEGDLSSFPGVSVSVIDGDMRAVLGLPNRPGVLVTRVSGPAEAAGMRPGALILEVNGKSPRTPREFADLVRETPAGGKAAIRYWQGGEERSVDLPVAPPKEPEHRL